GTTAQPGSPASERKGPWLSQLPACGETPCSSSPTGPPSPASKTSNASPLAGTMRSRAPNNRSGDALTLNLPALAASPAHGRSDSDPERPDRSAAPPRPAKPPLARPRRGTGGRAGLRHAETAGQPP